MNIVDLDKLCEMFWDGNYMEIHKDDISSIPSAFEGMTNGEVIQALFPNSKTETISFNGIRLYIDDEVHTKIADFTYRWWNAPYKAESEGTE